MREGQRSVIVEFVGMPGSGKSTLARATARLLRARGTQVWEPTYLLDHQTAPGLRQLRKLTYATRGLLANRSAAVAFSAAALRSEQRHARDLGSVTLNWWYLLDVHRRAASTSGVHLLDQGLLQALWSLGYAARNPETVLDGASMLLPRVRAPYVVVSLRVGHEIAFERLRARPNGASRLDREIDAGRTAAALARATMMTDAVEKLAGRLAEAGLITLVQLDNEARDGLMPNALALAERVTTLT